MAAVRSALAGVLLAGGTLPLRADVEYELVDLGTLDGYSAYAKAINNDGVVAGYYTADQWSGDMRAFVYRDGVMRDLGNAGNSPADVTGINAQGMIVGYSPDETGFNFRPFIWDAGALSLLPNLGLDVGMGLAINNAGVVVGTSYTNETAQHAVSYTNGVLTDLSGIVGGSASAATGINDAGDIVGWRSDGSVQRPFKLNSGSAIDLGTLTNAVMTQPRDINNQGIVVGVSQVGAFFRAYRQSGGSVEDLGTLGGDTSEPYAINEVGDIVGGSSTAQHEHHAFVVRDGVMIDLHPFLRPLAASLAGSHFNLWESVATGINDSGQVVGWVNGRAFLLNPIAANAPAQTPRLLEQSQDRAVASGDSSDLYVWVTGGHLGYQWQTRATANDAWVNAVGTGALTSNYQTPAMSVSAPVATQFRCVVTNAAGSLASDPIVVTHYPAMPFLSAPLCDRGPRDARITAGAQMTFDVVFTSTAGNVTYAWQVQIGGTGAWMTVAAGPFYQGQDSSRLTLTAQVGMSGNRYRCQAIDANGTTTSPAANLTLVAGPSTVIFAQQPQNAHAVLFTPVSFSVAVTGTPPYRYRWQFSDNQIDWARLAENENAQGVATATLHLPQAATGGSPSRYYRCLVYDKNSVTASAAAELTVDDSVSAPYIVAHPSLYTSRVGGAAAFFAGAVGTDPLSYQWQRKQASGSWTDLADTGPYSGSTTAVLSVSPVSITDRDALYRCIVTNAYGSIATFAAAIRVQLPVTDFNRDGAPDILLENSVTGQRVMWLMGGPNNAYVTQGLDLGFLDAAWRIVGTADFNGDGAPDILLENGTTGQRVLWLMGGPNNAYVQQGLDLGFLDAAWHIAGTADFNGDGAPDILLENRTSGQRVLWLMGGPSNAYVTQGLDLGVLDPAWHIAGLADFNADGGPDVLLENAGSGQRVLWLMSGPNHEYVSQGLDLGVLDPGWSMVKTADFNADGAPDILLENSSSGQRVLWLMGGPNNAYVTQGLDLGVLPAEWHIVK